jgi:hypothetical protein
MTSELDALYAVQLDAEAAESTRQPVEPNPAALRQIVARYLEASEYFMSIRGQPGGHPELIERKLQAAAAVDLILKEMREFIANTTGQNVVQAAEGSKGHLPVCSSDPFLPVNECPVCTKLNGAARGDE